MSKLFDWVQRFSEHASEHASELPPSKLCYACCNLRQAKTDPYCVKGCDITGGMPHHCGHFAGTTFPTRKEDA